jgi:hypothetical protein
LKKIYVFEKKIGSLGNGPRLLGEWVYSTPIFLKLAPTLGSVKCSIPHGDWRFYFFSNLEYTWTFISTIEIFVSKKRKITKKLTIFVSIMEKFCTLLQCKVHLSMYHSASTSKIWHTNT